MKQYARKAQRVGYLYSKTGYFADLNTTTTVKRSKNQQRVILRWVSQRG